MSLTPPDAGGARVEPAAEGRAQILVFDMPLRWSDQDVFGHLNHARFVTVLEEARLRWLNRLAVDEGVRTFVQPKLVASLHVDYLRPIEYDLRLELRLHLSRVGRTSYTIEYRALQRGEVRATARTTIVTVDESGAPRPLDDLERGYLGRFLAEAA